MNKKRVIHSKIRSSQKFGTLTLRQRDLWHGLIVMVDDQGRMPGIITYIRATVWPYDDFAIDEVASDLARLVDSGYIVQYSIKGEIYVQIINWWKYQNMQWAGPSNYPPPDGWVDRERFHGKGNIIQTFNWDLPGGYTNKASEQGSGQGSRLGSGLRSNEVKDEVKDDVNVKDEDNSSLVGVVSSLFEKEIGALTPMIGEQIKDWADNYPLSWIEDSIRIASGNNKRRVDYINGILKKKKIEGHGDNQREHGADTKDPEKQREEDAKRARERIERAEGEGK